MLICKNDDPRLIKEVQELKTKNPGLSALLDDLVKWIKANMGKDPVLTMVSRTKAEQDYIYRNDPRYKLKKFTSPHQLWQAIDLRSRTFTADEIKKIEAYLNTKYKGTNAFAWTAKCHKVTDGVDHFHIQFARK